MSGVLNLLLAGAASAIKDAYYNLTTLLLNTSSTNGAQNNTFLDSSTNNLSITRNGNTTQGTFSPFSQTGWSNYFASSSGVRFPDNAVFSMSTNPFTCECWVYITKSQGASTTFVSQWISGNDNNSSWMIGTNWGGGSGGSKFEGTISIGGSVTLVTDTSDFSLNTWHHVALCRSGSPGTLSLFVDGVRVASSTPTGSIVNATNSVGIGIRGGSNDSYADGIYISNVRVVNGTDVYGATNTTYTVPTTPLTNITNTSLLTCQSNKFVDNSSNALVATVSGTPYVQAFSPFAPTDAYSTSVVGGSAYFDGSGDFLNTSSSSAFNLNSVNWTIECYLYLGDYTGDARLWGVVSSSTTMFATYIRSGTLYLGAIGSSEVNMGSLTKGQWYHLAFVNVSGTITCFINGVSSATTSSYNFTNTDCSFYLAATPSNFSQTTTQGYFSDLRVLKGTALYTTTFTPPTAPLTAITNTQLLLNFTNTGIYDSTAKNDLETVGNAQVSTTQAKWGTTSMYFDGGGDFLVGNSGARTLEFLTGDFTVECWIRFITVGNGQIITADPTSSSIYWQYYSSELQIGQVGVGAITTASWSPSANTWYHIAVTRSGTTVRQFVDGTQLGTNATSSVSLVNGQVKIGSGGAGDFNGYIDDLRVTKGYARYTANFTPPAAAFALQ
jgi:hypothetical protein